MKYELPELSYGYNALEPFVDKETMIVHHTKHHQAYTDNFNKVLEKYPSLQQMKLEDIFRNLDSIDVADEDKGPLKNHGGGYINHKLFWEIMGPEKEIDDDLLTEIADEFGSVETFKSEFTKAAMGQFGSGWAWLAKGSDGKMKVYSLPNQDSPLTLGDTPILCLDVWEHAYYLKYQNRRAEFIENWWNVLKLV